MKRRYTSEKVALEWKYSRFNPLASIDPQRLVQALDMFDQGWLHDFALIYQKQEETDALLAAACPKRRAAAARLPWEISINEGFEDDPEAKLQQEFLNALYSNLSHRDALDLDYEEGVGGMLEAMALAFWLKKDVHELVWQPRGADMTVEAWHVNLAMFESTTGRLRYAGPQATLGKVELERGEWLVTSGYGIGQALSIASMFKSLGLKDWIAFNELLTQFGLHGKTSAARNSEEWNAFKNALQDFGPDWSILTGMDATVENVLVNRDPQSTFELLHQKMEAAQTRVIMGSDLSTISRENGVGASLQGSDQLMILENDARRLTETCNRWLDRPALQMRFGRDVTPLVAFRVIPPLQQDDKLEMEKDKHLKEMGVVQSIATLADKWSVDAVNMQDTTATQAAAPKNKTDSSVETLPASNAFDPDLHPRDITGKFATKAEASKGNEARRGEMRKGTDADRKKFGIAPAFKDIEVTDDPEADLLWTAKDEKGRRKYGYSAAYTQSQAAAKFARIGALHKAMPKLRERINEDIALGNEDLHQALTVRLITKTGLRNGGEDGGGKVKAYGASSLLTSHARVEGDTVHLDFIGKEGIRQRHSFSDKILARHVTMRQRMKNETLFDGDAAQTLDYMTRISDGKFKVHDLRTWYATTNADVITKKLMERGARPKNEKELKAFKKRVSKIVARDLGNGPAMALNNYIHPLVFQDVERFTTTKEAAR